MLFQSTTHVTLNKQIQSPAVGDEPNMTFWLLVQMLYHQAVQETCESG